MEPGEPVLRLDRVTAGAGGSRTFLDGIDLVVRRHEIVGIAGVSGNGQSALADLVSGLTVPAQGRMELAGEPVTSADPADMVRRGVARIPEDRHATGLVGDMTVWENLIAERVRLPEFSRMGFLKRRAARAWAERVIQDYDVRCPGPDAVSRLLSGGNMQKLILGRTLAYRPDLILANQPTRGLDVGAVAYVHGQLMAARKAGAGVLLISEDLDEILSLADRVCVMHRGRLSPPKPRDTVTIRELGLLMAGHWGEVADVA
jgi:simple sugar transport system ATP-binding protein